MKIRTDFVTNSSSSSFTVSIDVETKDGKRYGFYLGEDDGDGNCNDRFFGSLDNIFDSKIGRLKPAYSSVGELAQFLMDSVSDSYEGDYGTYDDFLAYLERHGLSEDDFENGKGDDEDYEDDEDDDDEDDDYEDDDDDMDYEDVSVDFLRELKEKRDAFKNKLVGSLSSVDDISKITVHNDYSAWGEFAQNIVDHDRVLRTIAKKVASTHGEEQQAALKEMRNYLHSGNVKENLKNVSFGWGYNTFRYTWEDSDDALIRVANRLDAEQGPDSEEAREIQELDLKNNTLSKYVEITLR